MLALVTGANGRIGSHLVDALLEKGHSVRALVIESGEELGKRGVDVRYGDVALPETLAGVADGVDVVFHLAALINNAPKEAIMRVNVEGTKNMLLACMNSGISRFVHVSSISAMGKKLASVPADEKTQCNPERPYEISKLEGEKAALAAHIENGLPVSVIRPAVVYGKGFERSYFKLLSAIEKGRMPILGNGENFLHFVHVSDVVSGLLLAAEKKEAVGEVFLIADDEARKQKEVLALAALALGAKPPKIRIPLWLANALARLMGFSHMEVIRLTSNRAFNISKAKAILGYEPKVKLEEGMAEMAEYYRAWKEMGAKRE